MPQYVPGTAIEVDSVDGDGCVLEVYATCSKKRCCALARLSREVCLVITGNEDLGLVRKTWKVQSHYSSEVLLIILAMFRHNEIR